MVETARAPQGKVRLSQGISVGNWLFCSGQVPRDPTTGQLVHGGMERQARRVLDNLAAICEAAGTSLAHAVKVSIYLADLSELGEMNRVFEEYFGTIDPPARTTVQATLIDGARLEMDLVAVISPRGE